MIEIAIEQHIGNPAAEIGIEPGAQLAQPLRLLGHFGAGQRGGAAKADAERGRQCAGAQPPLLPAAIDQRQ